MDGKTNANVYLEDLKVFIDGIMFAVSSIKVNTVSHSRFFFGNFEGKIHNGMFTYTDNTTGVSKALAATKQEQVSQQSGTWDNYVIYHGKTVSINSLKTKVKVDETETKVNEIKKEGIYTCYVTDLGILAISSNEELRQSMWDNIKINLKGY
jgi:hypothetical protein